MATHSITLPADQTLDKPCPCGCAPCPDGDCGLECITAPRFFCGQLLTDGDLTAMVGWARAKLRLERHRVGWGVVCGLDVMCDPASPSSVIVTPGYAVTACGDDVILCEPAAQDLSAACGDDQGPCATLPPAGRETVRVAVDLSVAYAEVDTQLQAALARGVCDRTAECEPARTRETYKLSWKVGNGGNPIALEAADFLEAWDGTLNVVREFRGQFGEPGNDGNDWALMRNWLVRWIDAHGPHHFCSVRHEICAAGTEENPGDGFVCGALFGIVQDARTVLVVRGCGASERTAGVPIARVWLEREEKGETCRVVLIDPFVPNRRELGSDRWPAPAGGWNAGQVIWRQPHDACRRLTDAGFATAGTVDFQVGDSVADLEQALDCDPFLDCGDEPTLQVLDHPLLGERVVGLCGAPKPAPATRLGLQITKTAKVKTAVPGDGVTYDFLVTNTGEEPLKVDVLDSRIQERWLAELEPGASEPMFGKAVVEGEPGTEFVNTVEAVGTAPDGRRTVRATATCTIMIVKRGDDGVDPAVEPVPEGVEEARDEGVVVIPGIGDKRAAELEKAGIATVGDLADAPLDRIAEAFARGQVTASAIREWKREAAGRIA